MKGKPSHRLLSNKKKKKEKTTQEYFIAIAQTRISYICTVPTQLWAILSGFHN